MKRSIKKYRIFVLIWSIIFLCYSCKVYYKTPVTLDEAVQHNNRVKLYTISDQEFKFRRIVKTDTAYYGQVKSKGRFENIQINSSDIEKIRLHDKTMSTVYTVLLSLLVVPVLIAIIYGISGGMSFEFDWDEENP